MKKGAIFSLILTIALIFSSCGGGVVEETTNKDAETTGASVVTSEAETENSEETTSSSSADSAEGMFTDRDSDTSYRDATVNITLSGNTASASSDSVKISGGTIVLSEEATYIISGTLTDGMIYVNADETAKLQIVLNGANITSSTSAALYILSCDKVFVTLEEGSENTLSNGGAFEAIDENNIDGAVFSKQDLTFNGSGTLTVSSPSSHAVVCKDDLVFTGGSYIFESASHGLDVNDSVRVKNSNISIAAGKDGIHCENDDNAEKGFIYVESGNFDISAEGDGISAGTTLEIKGGTFDIITGGGSENAEAQTSSDWGGFMGGKGSMGGIRPGMSGASSSSTDTSEDSESIKGIKAAGNISISGGTFTIDSADDGVHSNMNITVSGGVFTIATGDDGMHADETLTVSGGDINVTESYEGLEGLHIKITDGNISLYSSDDGLNAAGGTDSSGTGGFRGGDMFGGGMSSGNGSIVISGGTSYINASGDGIDANGTLEITGGHTTVTGPTQGDTATLDYDKTAVITGGTFIGTGASGMAQTFSDSQQGVIAVSVGTQRAGTNIVLTDKNGNTLIEYAPELSFGVVILSSPDIVKGEKYTLGIGDAEGSFEAN